MFEKEYVVIRDPKNFAGTYEKPIFDVIIQTNVRRNPIDITKLSVGEKIWLKWKNGPIIMYAEINSFEKGTVEDGNLDELRNKTKDFPTYHMNDYWDSLVKKNTFYYTMIYLKNNNYLDEPIQPNRMFNRNTWIVIDNIEVKKEWFPDYISERINDSMNSILDNLDIKTRNFFKENEDILALLNDVSNENITPEKKKTIVHLYKRNSKLVNKLKKAYKNKCQICGFRFKKKNLEYYSELHHLVSIGEEGSDSLDNLVNLCANCHRKMHYANVEFGELKNNERKVWINGKLERIIYHPDHFKLIEANLN